MTPPNDRYTWRDFVKFEPPTHAFMSIPIPGDNISVNGNLYVVAEVELDSRTHLIRSVLAVPADEWNRMKRETAPKPAAAGVGSTTVNGETVPVQWKVIE